MARQAHHSPNYGGARAGAGRLGSPHKFSRDIARKAAEDGQHPYEYLLEVMRDESEDKARRMYCANACLPYCLQKLVSTEVVVVNELDKLSLVEKVALAASLRATISEQRPEMTLPELPSIEGELV